MIRPSLAMLSVPLALLAWTAPAAANDAGPSSLAPGDAGMAALLRDLTTAERSVGDALTASDGCAVACRALDSMRRATDRICAIDSGAPCEDARRRTAGAEARVAQSCPCAVAEESRASTKTADSAKKPAAAEPISVSGSAADTAPHRGGCASCAVGERRGARDTAALWAIAIGAIAIARRRRRR